MLFAANLTVTFLVVLAVLLSAITLPGNLLIFLIAAAYGYYDQFLHFDFYFLLALFGMYALGEVIEFLAGVFGARREKAARPTMVAAVVGSIAGGILGTAILPLIGSFGGAMFGGYAFSYFVEFIITGSREKSRKVATSVLKGQAMGLIVKTGVAVAMALAIILKLPWQN